MNDYNFGNFICMLREQKGMTQADIADRLGVTPAAVSKWENGSSKPRVEILFQLADILGVRSEELMAGHYLPTETLVPEAVKQINERYDYLRKVDCHNTAGVKFRRFLAAIIDWNLVGLCVLFSLGFFMSFFKDRLSTDSAVFILGMLFIFSLYPAGFILRDVLFGSRSIGKRITGLIVFDKQTGMPAKAGKRILRNLFLPIMQADVIVMFASGSTVGDRVAHTVVLPRKAAETTADNTKPNIAEINQYTAPKPRNVKKIVFDIVGSVVGFICLVLLITLVGLEATKSSEEYKVAYQYLVQSQAFQELNAEESAVFMNSYSLQTYPPTDDDPTTGTVKMNFIIHFKSFTVICHQENGVWQVCQACTKFT